MLLKELLAKKIKAYHIPKIIVSHGDKSSTSNPGSNDFISARAAAKYVEYGNGSLFWMFKYLLFLLRKKHIKASSLIEKYQVGYRAIKKIKRLTT